MAKVMPEEPSASCSRAVATPGPAVLSPPTQHKQHSVAKQWALSDRPIGNARCSVGRYQDLCCCATRLLPRAAGSLLFEFHRLIWEFLKTGSPPFSAVFRGTPKAHHLFWGSSELQKHNMSTSRGCRVDTRAFEVCVCLR